MKIHDTDYHNISDKDKGLWEQLKAKEMVYHEDKLTQIRKSFYTDYPKSVRHFLSLFPNNFIDAVDLIQEAAHLKKVLMEFEILMNNSNTTERPISKFIKDKRAYFIIASILKSNYRFGHNALFLFPEFEMPPNYQADYLMVGENSDGHHFIFIELENPYNDITTQDGSYGTTIRKGIKQIEDWEVWLERYFSNLKLVFEGLKNKQEILPKEFRDFDKTRIHYVVVAGRRSDYSERTYRLRRNNLEQRKALILHYDNLIEYAKKTIETAWF